MSRTPFMEASDRSQLEMRRALEAILFVSYEPVASGLLAQALERPRQEVESVLGDLARDYDERGSGIVLREVAGGWRLFTHADASPYVEHFVLSSRHSRLTRASLETLAIVAYKQPVTRHQVSSIRGVNCDGVLRALTERGLLEEVDRDVGPGRAVLYGTTSEFLERLGIASLADLPPVTSLLADAGAERTASPPG
jgi:segregation and condensation protein B